MRKIGCKNSAPINKGLRKMLLVMKISTILLLAFSIQISAKVRSQTNITIDLKDVTISKVLNIIERNTEYRFLYRDNSIPADKKVTIKIDNGTIGEALAIVFNNTSLAYKISNKNLIIVLEKERLAFEKIVKGKITNAKGEPISGVTILEKGTNIGVTSNAKGAFEINVTNDNALLLFSSIGFESQEITVGARAEINVTLVAKDIKLDEVVINVGYGTQKKRLVTSAISSVTAKDLEDVPNGRIETALQGRVAGITVAANSGQPGSNSTIRIRGVTTFGDNEPLYVVDGIIVNPAAIAIINQNDIQSVDVLKDASSAAIYGTRAAAGVILITTKKGKFSSKLAVAYNGFYGTSAPAKILDLLNATQYATLLNERSTAGGGPVLFTNLSTLGKGTDWQKEIFNNNALRSNHDVSLSGGSEKSTFFLSFGLQDQNGIVATDISSFKRQSIRLNSTHKVGKMFTFGQTVSYVHKNQSGLGNTNSEFGGPLSSAINLDPITKIVVTDPVEAAGSPYNSSIPVVRDRNGNPYGISAIVGQEMTNPLAYIQTRLGGYSWSDDIIANANVEMAVSKHLKIKSSVGAKLTFYGDQYFNPVSFLSPTISTAKNNFTKTYNKFLDWNWENTAEYTNSIYNHNFSVLLGTGAYVEGIGGGNGTTIFDIPVSNYQDASFNFPVTQANRTSGTYTASPGKIASLFGRINYNYKEKYLLTVNTRRDGSSRFGANFKYGVFPSFSAGWVASSENFWKQNKVINYLKIRGGYGSLGNDKIGNFGYLSIIQGNYNYSLGTNGTVISGFAPKTLDNPDLRWEKTTQSNIGFNARLLNNFNLSVDFYDKVTTGILRPIPIPGYVGVSDLPLGNVASMQNKGVDIELGYRKMIGKVNIDVNGSFGLLKNQVTKVDRDKDFINGDASFQSMGAVTRIQVGQSYNTFYGYKTAGVFQNLGEVNANINKTGGLIQPNAVPGDFRWEDTDGDGVITEKDKQFLGTNIPKFTYGFSVKADYGGFDVLVFAQGAGGNKIFQGLRRLDITTANFQTKALGRWTGDGTTNTNPRLTSNDVNGNYSNMSDFYLEKGDYMRIKIVQLGYTVNSKYLDKIGASRLRVYLTAENLLTLTNYTGYDPEVGGGVYGIDKGQYPQARSFLAGVQLQF